MTHTRMTTLTELIKDDKSHSFGAYFYILVCRYAINFNKDPSIFSSPEQRHGELLYYPRRRHPKMLKFSLKFLRPHYPFR